MRPVDITDVAEELSRAKVATDAAIARHRRSAATSETLRQALNSVRMIATTEAARLHVAQLAVSRSHMVAQVLASLATNRDSQATAFELVEAPTNGPHGFVRDEIRILARSIGAVSASAHFGVIIDCSGSVPVFRVSHRAHWEQPPLAGAADVLAILKRMLSAQLDNKPVPLPFDAPLSNRRDFEWGTSSIDSGVIRIFGSVSARRDTDVTEWYQTEPLTLAPLAANEDYAFRLATPYAAEALRDGITGAAALLRDGAWVSFDGVADGGWPMTLKLHYTIPPQQVCVRRYLFFGPNDCSTVGGGTLALPVYAKPYAADRDGRLWMFASIASSPNGGRELNPRVPLTALPTGLQSASVSISRREFKISGRVFPRNSN
jgi:hypothetical protein